MAEGSGDRNVFFCFCFFKYQVLSFQLSGTAVVPGAFPSLPPGTNMPSSIYSHYIFVDFRLVLL